ncbi:hypothetical protein [Variovorax soli]|uniref:hypothetical protein n=1 Tax=Variovorax soli TaxID=376815 RepID=UPI00286B34BA|nr:hypothetical protein [Variovorax soli]
MPHVQSGRLRALAVTATESLERFPGIPALPVRRAIRSSTFGTGSGTSMPLTGVSVHSIAYRRTTLARGRAARKAVKLQEVMAGANGRSRWPR